METQLWNCVILSAADVQGGAKDLRATEFSARDILRLAGEGAGFGMTSSTMERRAHTKARGEMMSE